MDLTVAIYGGQDCDGHHAKPWLDAFANGLSRHGIYPIRRPGSHRLPNADLVVFWSHKVGHVIEHQRNFGKDYLVLEHGYFGDRVNKFASARFNGLNGSAQNIMFISDAPSDRWEKHEVEVKPWKCDGEYALILGQVDGDASLVQSGFSKRWYSEAAVIARNTFGLPVRFRPHPKSRPTTEINGARTLVGSLEEALDGAAFAITWNSTAGVNAVLYGVPTAACDGGSMARPVAAHFPSGPILKADRKPWLNHLAYCQWTKEEFASGEAWDHLRMKYGYHARNAGS